MSLKVELWYIGKTREDYIKQGMQLYSKRIGHYANYSTQEFKRFKKMGSLSPNQIKVKEEDLLMSKIEARDCIILLDERGKLFESVGFANKLETLKTQGHSKLIFIVGGAFGFGERIKQRANLIISLSKLTFPHELVRLIFLEQLYRAFTILNQEKYHNP